MPGFSLVKLNAPPPSPISPPTMSIGWLNKVSKPPTLITRFAVSDTGPLPRSRLLVAIEPRVPAKNEKSEAQICGLLVESVTALPLVFTRLIGALIVSVPVPIAELLLRCINVKNVIGQVRSTAVGVAPESVSSPPLALVKLPSPLIGPARVASRVLSMVRLLVNSREVLILRIDVGTPVGLMLRTGVVAPSLTNSRRLPETVTTGLGFRDALHRLEVEPVELEISGEVVVGENGGARGELRRGDSNRERCIGRTHRHRIPVRAGFH